MPAATATNAAGVAAEEDPLTGLPNLRALESHLQSCPQQAICSLRIDNLDFLSRHYGLMMGVDCKRQIIRALQPLLGAADKVFRTGQRTDPRA